MGPGGLTFTVGTWLSFMYCPWADAESLAPDVVVVEGDIAPARGALARDLGVIILASGMSRVEGRCVLAHELAHVRLGHRACGVDWLDGRCEREAVFAAARALISVESLADALVWCVDDREVAEELCVVVAVVTARRECLTPDEIAVIEERIGQLERSI